MAAKGVGVVGSIWLARCLDPRHLGVVSLMFALQTPILRLLPLGLDQIVLRATAVLPNDETRSVFRYFGRFRIRNAVIASLIWLFIATAAFSKTPELFTPALIATPLLFCGSINWLSAAQRLAVLSRYVLLEFVVVVVTTAFLVLLVGPGDNAAHVLAVYGACGIVGAIAMWLWGKRTLGDTQAADAAMFERHVKLSDGRWPLVVAISSYVYAALEIPIVAAFYGLAAAGEYRVGTTFGTGVLTLVGAVAAFTYPKYVEWASDPVRLMRKLNIVARCAAFVIGAGAITLQFTAEAIVTTVFGEKYEGIGFLVALIASAKLLVLWVNIWSLSLLALKEERYVGVVTLGAACISAFVNILCGVLNGNVIAVAAISCACETFVGFLCWWRVRCVVRRMGN